jgi:MFS family permease
MPVAGTRNTGLTSAAPLAWETNHRLPRGVAAVLAALRFSTPAPELLQRFSNAEWKTALAFTDRSGLTLILGALYRDYLPAWVRERIERDLANNTERIGRLRAALVEVIEQLNARGIEHLLIKGLSQEVDFVADPYLRVGYDIDLFAPPESLGTARETVESLGYEAIADTWRFPADHIPPMIRKTRWQWNEDYFDPGIPPCIDLHFRFWDPATEGFPAPGVEDFWARRTQQDGLPVLGRTDRLGYAALHLLRHLFRGDLRPFHVYEIAYFLETHPGDEAFWSSWRETHPPALRCLEAIAFRLARAWFGCRLAPVVAEAMDELNPGIQLWFEHYAAAPLEAQFRPNKDEMWLQFELLVSPRDRVRLIVRRLLPATLPVADANAFVPENELSWRMRMRGAFKYASHLIGRAVYHIRAVPPVIAHGLIWKSRTSQLQAPFWRFLLSNTLFDIGMFQFTLLYNLYLLDLGYRENVLGLISGAFTAGNLAGVLPAAALANRYGLKRTILTCVAGTAALCALRATVHGEPALLASAFAGGVFLSLWFVSISPSVASLTSETARPKAFSIIFGWGIALGVVAGVTGGLLPGWVTHYGLAASPRDAKQVVLFASAALAALALWPLARLRIEPPRPRETRSYPRDPFIRRFLVAIGVWGFAMGVFGPLFNAYFAREFRMPVERIGIVFSFAQAAQVIAMLFAPLLLRRLGLTRGVAIMQLATALALALLAPTQMAVVAAVLYTSYVSFQYMSEPGIYSCLMNRVLPGQRSGASALNYLVLFGAQTLAASLAGAVVTRYGYPPTLAGAAVLAAVAAWLFWRLPQESSNITERELLPGENRP